MEQEIEIYVSYKGTKITKKDMQTKRYALKWLSVGKGIK